MLTVLEMQIPGANLTNAREVDQKTPKIVVLKRKPTRPAVRKYTQTELTKSEERAFLFFFVARRYQKNLSKFYHARAALVPFMIKLRAQ